MRDALTNFIVNSVEAIGASPGRVRLSAEKSDAPGQGPQRPWASSRPGVLDEVAEARAWALAAAPGHRTRPVCAPAPRGWSWASPCPRYHRRRDLRLPPGRGAVSAAARPVRRRCSSPRSSRLGRTSKVGARGARCRTAARGDALFSPRPPRFDYPDDAASTPSSKKWMSCASSTFRPRRCPDPRATSALPRTATPLRAPPLILTVLGEEGAATAIAGRGAAAGAEWPARSRRFSARRKTGAGQASTSTSGPRRSWRKLPRRGTLRRPRGTRCAGLRHASPQPERWKPLSGARANAGVRTAAGLGRLIVSELRRSRASFRFRFASSSRATSPPSRDACCPTAGSTSFRGPRSRLRLRPGVLVRARRCARSRHGARLRGRRPRAIPVPTMGDRLRFLALSALTNLRGGARSSWAACRRTAISWALRRS